MLVEIWVYGKKDGNNFILVTPHALRDAKHEDGWHILKNTNGYVENGCYYVTRNKKKNIMRVHGAPGGSFETECHYLGDVNYTGDYNATIGEYEDTKKVLGKNTIKVKKLNVETDKDHLNPAF